MKIALKIVGIIGLVLWTACCFFGLFYSVNGLWLPTIVITLLIAVALFLSYLLMLKMQDTSATMGNRDRAKRTGIIMLCVYVLASLVSAFYINHFIRTFECKDEIRAKVGPALDELNLTFDYVDGTDTIYSDKVGSYLNWVGGALDSYKIHLEAVGTNGYEDTQISQLKDRLTGKDSESDSDYYTLAYEVKEKLGSIQNVVIDRWWITLVFQRLNELQTQKSLWESKVLEFSQRDEWAKTNHAFQLQSNHNYNDLTAPLTQTGFKVSGLSILIIVVLQVIILLGYLLGLKSGGKNDKIITDDHGSIRSWSSSN